MKMSEMFPSKWLSKDDVKIPVAATIRDVTREEIKGDGGNETKNVVVFAGDVKPMILNVGNAQVISELYGDDTRDWAGKSIEIYHDPSVMFGGKRVGGVRVRAPQQNAFAAQQTTANGHESRVKWDVSDGHNVTTNLSSEDARKTLLDAGPEKFKIRAAGTNNQPKTGPEWLAEHFADPIPF